MELIRIRTRSRDDLVEITDVVQGAVDRSGVSDGVIVLQSLHTTAGLTINENADPDVTRDLIAKLQDLVPRKESYYQHAEGNSDSHLKTSMMGPSLSVLISDHRLVLGTWQGIYLCEWDGPRDREVAFRVMKG